jgi:hypothetical protein
MGTDRLRRPSGTRYPLLVRGYRGTSTGYRSGTSTQAGTSRAAEGWELTRLGRPWSHPRKLKVRARSAGAGEGLSRRVCSRVHRSCRTAPAGRFGSVSRRRAWNAAAKAVRQTAIAHPCATPQDFGGAFTSPRSVGHPSGAALVCPRAQPQLLRVWARALDVRSGLRLHASDVHRPHPRASRPAQPDPKKATHDHASH